MLVLEIILYILLAILVLLLLLLITPVCVKPVYQQEKLSVYLTVLLFKFKIYPLSKKEKVKVKNADKKAKEQGEKAIKKDVKSRLPIYFEDIAEIICIAGGAIKLIFKCIYFRNIRIFYPVFKDNAAQTAIYYGKLQAYINNAFALLNNILNIKVKSIKLLADFNNEHEKDTYLSCKINAIPIVFIIAAIYVFRRLKINKII